MYIKFSKEFKKTTKFFFEKLFFQRKDGEEIKFPLKKKFEIVKQGIGFSFSKIKYDCVSFNSSEIKEFVKIINFFSQLLNTMSHIFNLSE